MLKEDQMLYKIVTAKLTQTVHTFIKRMVILNR
jgi:hypothetical protein